MKAPKKQVTKKSILDRIAYMREMSKPAPLSKLVTGWVNAETVLDDFRFVQPSADKITIHQTRKKCIESVGSAKKIFLVITLER